MVDRCILVSNARYTSINHATVLEKSFVMTMVELLLLQIGVVASVRQWLLARQNPMSGTHWCSCNVFQIQKSLEGSYCGASSLHVQDHFFTLQILSRSPPCIVHFLLRLFKLTKRP